MTRFVNNVKTAMLLGLMFGIVLAVGSIWGQQGIMMAFLFGGMGTVITYFFSDKIALAAMKGQQVDRKSEADLYTMVERLSRNANLPMPKVYICPQEAPNAFATGRNPKNAAVAVTQGALRLMTYEELEGVMAHELAHVKNRDTLISCVAATIAGALQMLGWMFMFGGGNRNVHPVVLIAMIILAPIAAGIIQMAISRSREFVADADGAKIAGSPRGLIDALRKLENYSKRIPMEGEMPAANHMFIIKPMNAMSGNSLASLFSTHPATEKRIAKLQELI